MKRLRRAGLCLLLVLVALAVWQFRPRYQAPPPQPSAALLARYPWPLAEATYDALWRRFPAPRGFTRVALPPESWGAWLRGLPLRRPGTPVVNGAGQVRLPGAWPQLGAVVDIDLRRNEQCADIIYRLRAEWLWVTGHPEQLSFRATDGSTLSWADWKRGVRPVLAVKKLVYVRTAQPDGSRTSFDRYLAAIFNWCGTLSLDRDTVPVTPGDVQPGDILVKGGAPGHAMLIVDLAQDRAGHRQALVAQGWLPEQSIYVVSPLGQRGWFGLDPKHPIDVPMWGRFEWSDLQRFPSPTP
jgi:hypothetical protein